MPRWASFDCYGTLIDWNAGIRAELARVFGDDRADARLAAYHELEPELEHDGQLSYREVMTEAMRRLGAPGGEEAGLAGSLPTWQPFPEASAALQELRNRGWRLGILSNTDRDLIDASIAAIGIPFGAAIVAGDLGSYKPAPRHWEAFREHTRVQPEAHVHVAQSLYHDVGTATELGIPSIWINRLGEPPDPRPCATLSSLTGLADALDEIVPG